MDCDKLLLIRGLFRDIKCNRESSADLAGIKNNNKIQRLHISRLLTKTTPRLSP